MRNIRQRRAINQAQIRKECKLYGPFAEGTRAFRNKIRRRNNPYNDLNRACAWDQGWELAQLKQQEKDDAPT